ncbi:MAG TPA: hypothetical protein VF132_05230 [Rudaea sp.]
MTLKPRFSARFFLAALCVCAAANATDGDYDTNWGDGGRLRIDVTSPGRDRLSSMFVQPDGKIVMSGTCTISFPILCMTRLLPNGSYDPAFGPASHPGRVLITDASGDLTMAGVARRGEDYVVFNTLVYPEDSTHAFGQVRIVTTTGVDLSPTSQNFNYPSYQAERLAVQPDGKVLLLGLVDTPAFVVSRLSANFDVDSVFGDGGTKEIRFPGAAVASASAMALQPDGKIVVVGRVDNKLYVVRLLPSGQLDDDPVVGFGDGGRSEFNLGGPGSYAEAVAIDRNGCIVIAGATFTSSFDFAVNRLTPRGAQDPGFNYTCVSTSSGISCSARPNIVAFDLGGTSNDHAYAVALQSDGRIVVGGLATRVAGVQYFAAARLRRDGQLDLSFGDHGTTYGRYGALDQNVDEADSVAITGGGIFVAGYSRLNEQDEPRFGIAKMKVDLIFADDFE